MTAGSRGEFVVARFATAEYQEVILSATFNSVLVAKKVMIGQRVATLALSGAPGDVIVPCDAVPITPGAIVPVYARIRGVHRARVARGPRLRLRAGGRVAVGGVQDCMPIKRLLIAVDLTPASLAVTKWAAVVFAPTSEVVLAHVVEIPTPPGFMQSLFAPMAQVLGVAVPGARTQLQELCDSLELPARSTVIDVRGGPAAKSLIEAATEHRSELMVIGRHRNRGGLARFLGSTASKVVRNALCPVLVVSQADAPTTAPRRILAAVDDGPSAPRVLHWAAAAARDHQAELVAVHVVDAALAGALAITNAPRERERAHAKLREFSESWLRGQISGLGLPAGKVRAIVRDGNPAGELVSVAAEERCDLLVIGRSASGMTNTLGSVADFVLRSNEGMTVIVPA